MANYLDKEDDETDAASGGAALPAGPQGKSTDVSSKSGLSQAWDAWTSKPENNAAMINFGLQLMQPMQIGQNRLGHFAQAIGAGGEAATRNILAQEEEQKREEESALKEREATRKERETDLYGQYVNKQTASSKPETMRMQAQIRMQAKRNEDFSKWLSGKDLFMDDTLFRQVQRKFPNIKEKADIRADPEAFRYAQSEHAKAYVPDPEDAVASAGAAGATKPTFEEFAARAGPANPKMDRAQLKAYYDKYYQ